MLEEVRVKHCVEQNMVQYELRELVCISVGSAFLLVFRPVLSDLLSQCPYFMASQVIQADRDILCYSLKMCLLCTAAFR